MGGDDWGAMNAEGGAVDAEGGRCAARSSQNFVHRSAITRAWGALLAVFFLGMIKVECGWKIDWNLIEVGENNFWSSIESPQIGIVKEKIKKYNFFHTIYLK